VREALATADLRRVQLAWAISAIGSWVLFVALAVYAYDVAGATGVGVAALVRMIPAGLAAPLAGVVVDRYPRRDVLVVSLVGRAAVVAAAAGAVATDAPPGAVFALAAAFTVLASAHKPAQAALLPGLAETPRQLAACNAIWSAVDNSAFLVGSLAGGALIATTGVAEALALTALLCVLAAIPTASIPRDTVPEFRARDDRGHAVREALAGFGQVAADRELRLVVGFLTVTTLVEGAVDVLVVVVALELLDLPSAGVGWLNACWGAGGLAGGVASLVLLRRGRLAAGLAAGGLMVGLSLMGIAGLATPLAAGALLVVLGIGYALIETAGLSLLQRLSSDEVIGRAFAVVEGGYWISTGVGAIVAPALIAGLGLRGALVAVGACLPLIVALRRAALARLEAGAEVPVRAFTALRSVPVFAPLPLAAVENVSRRVVPVSVAAGEVLIREGEPGDRFYVVAEGRMLVECRGQALGERGPGEYFGEIALLRDVPRTATITARDDALLYALDRDAFLFAIDAHWRSAAEINDVADSRRLTVEAT
jgi:MFS family permease